MKEFLEADKPIEVKVKDCNGKVHDLKCTKPITFSFLEELDKLDDTSDQPLFDKMVLIFGKDAEFYKTISIQLLNKVYEWLVVEGFRNP